MKSTTTVRRSRTSALLLQTDEVTLVARAMRTCRPLS
jgi:hypothetical protein